MPPEVLWNETKEFSGIDKTFFDKYFKNRKIAYAYKLGKVKEYKHPKELKDLGINFVPQSFVYIS